MPADTPVLFGSANSKQLPPSTSLSIDKDSDPQNTLHQVTEQIYKQNFELMVRNKTLSTLRVLYPITLSSLNVTEISQKIVDAAILELNLQEAMIHIIDPEDKSLMLQAIGQSNFIPQIEEKVGKPKSEWRIPKSEENNLLNTVIKENKHHSTNSVESVFRPLVSEKSAQEIQKMLNIESLLIFPLASHAETLGTITFGFAKKIDELSRTEIETIEEIINLVSIAIDRAKLYEDLQTANEKLQELDKLKDEFVSLASHELRTPMAAIKGSISTVLEGYAGTISEEAREFLTAAYNENDRLIRLVNNLLNTSRIEAGRLSFSTSRVNMGSLITEVVKNLQMAAKEKNIYLTYEPFGFLPEVIADEDKIKEVIINLIGNGIKFTTTGGLTIKTIVEGDFIKTSVADTGIGIHGEDFDLLFRKFSQVKQQYTKTIGGTGLGLYISRKIIEGLGGKIWLESEVGKGTTFYFTLPIAK